MADAEHTPSFSFSLEHLVSWVILRELNLDFEFNDKVLRFQVELDGLILLAVYWLVTQAVHTPLISLAALTLRRRAKTHLKIMRKLAYL
jgi:hypothetical protein